MSFDTTWNALDHTGEITKNISFLFGSVAVSKIVSIFKWSEKRRKYANYGMSLPCIFSCDFLLLLKFPSELYLLYSPDGMYTAHTHTQHKNTWTFLKFMVFNSYRDGKKDKRRWRRWKMTRKRQNKEKNGNSGLKIAERRERKYVKATK